MSQSAEAILQFHSVSKFFDGHPAVNNLSFSLPCGHIVGLLGPNGSGKTTTLKLINGLLQPDAGSIQVAGLAPGVETKRLVSYLPERTYLSDWMRVSDILAFFSDFYEDFDIARAKQMLFELHIAEGDRLKTMSKGTKEKVQLILVMSRRARLYLLDEPIGGVDPAARDYILRTILQNYEPTATVVISTHLIQDVEKIFDDVLFLNGGELVLSGSVDAVRQENGKSIDALFREVFKC